MVAFYFKNRLFEGRGEGASNPKPLRRSSVQKFSSQRSFKHECSPVAFAEYPYGIVDEFRFPFGIPVLDEGMIVPFVGDFS